MEKKLNIQETINKMNHNKFIHAQNAHGETAPLLDFSIQNWNLQNMGFKSEFEGCW